jgi:hypothetical protein
MNKLVYAGAAVVAAGGMAFTSQMAEAVGCDGTVMRPGDLGGEIGNVHCYDGEVTQPWEEIHDITKGLTIVLGGASLVLAAPEAYARRRDIISFLRNPSAGAS